ncbi:MAG: hypothetical protein NT123_22865 [Proteobacteria bacterium]|nr:hypothetical protein [Pseudomonadota bacterium]
MPGWQGRRFAERLLRQARFVDQVVRSNKRTPNSRSIAAMRRESVAPGTPR